MRIVREGDGFAVECRLVITAEAEKGIKDLAKIAGVHPGDIVSVVLKRFAADVGLEWEEGKRTFENPDFASG